MFRGMAAPLSAVDPPGFGAAGAAGSVATRGGVPLGAGLPGASVAPIVGPAAPIALSRFDFVPVLEKI